MTDSPASTTDAAPLPTPDSPLPPLPADLDALSRVELFNLAQARNLKPTVRMKIEDLLHLLRTGERTGAPAAAEPEAVQGSEASEPADDSQEGDEATLPTANSQPPTATGDEAAAGSDETEPSEPAYEVDPAKRHQLKLSLPLANFTGKLYLPRKIELRLSSSQQETLRQLQFGLNETGVLCKSPAQTLGWLLDEVAKQVG